MIARHRCLILFWLYQSCLASALPYLNFRSQSTHAERELVGLTQQINKAVDHFYSCFSATAVYTQSFEANRIADCLFGTDLRTATLSALDITGSGVDNRDTEKQWLADYFGLPRDFSSTVRFEPMVSNTLVDLYWYFGLNNLLCGSYASIYLPIGYTHWDLNYFEAINKEGVADQPSGYFNQQVAAHNVGVKRTDLLRSFADFVFKGNRPDLGEQVTFSPLEAAKMTPNHFHCNKSKIGFSDLLVTLGWNFLLDRWYHLGIGLRAAAPTGNRPNGTYLFEPILGNGKHWQAGLQLWGHYTFYVSENEEKQWMVYCVMNSMHLFNAKQCRVFDLLCKPNSRWMLAEKMTDQVTNIRAALEPDDVSPDNLFIPSAQFANNFTPVANLTQRTVNVSIPIQIDAVLMFSYLNKNLNVDFGYNLWYRSCERIKKAHNHSPFEGQLWALKGDSYIFGFTGDENPAIDENIPVALSATQSKATIHAGTNNFVDLNGDMGGIDGLRPTRNPGVDNRYYAAATFDTESVILNDRTEEGEQTSTSFNPIFLSEEDVNICGAASKGVSNSVFIHINYAWFNYHDEDRVPFIGGGISCEFGNSSAPSAVNQTSCSSCAISQCSVWLKGGVSFD